MGDLRETPTLEPLTCEVCDRVLTKVRVGPSIVRSGWRCGSPECAPHAKGAPVIAPAHLPSPITSTTAPTTQEGESRASSD